jgi:hypothetical protein
VQGPEFKPQYGQKRKKSERKEIDGQVTGDAVLVGINVALVACTLISSGVGCFKEEQTWHLNLSGFLSHYVPTLSLSYVLPP